MLLTRPPLTRRSVRLACMMHAANVSPEPGSNSPLWILVLAGHSWDLRPSCSRKRYLILCGDSSLEGEGHLAPASWIPSKDRLRRPVTGFLFNSQRSLPGEPDVSRLSLGGRLCRCPPSGEVGNLGHDGRGRQQPSSKFFAGPPLLGWFRSQKGSRPVRRAPGGPGSRAGREDSFARSPPGAPPRWNRGAAAACGG